MNVVIVGRPNVGKSTLFNRIVRRRIAITLKESGTTRDRISTQTQWNKTKFTLTDTGGYITEKDDNKKELSKQVNFQIEQAIKSADVIIFLVDGSGSPTAQDFAIAELLRKSNKPFVLAINKTDIKATKENLHEFYKFGSNELIPISAEHGIGIDDLLDAVIEKIGNWKLEIGNSTAETFLRLLIIGRPNVGKSLFLNRILNQERVIVSEKPGTTRDAIEEEFVFDNKKIKIIDTAGLRKKPKVKESVEYFSVQRAIKYIPTSDVIILLLDAQTDAYPPMPLTNQDRNIIQLVLDRGKGVVIAINKIDLVSAQERKDLFNNTIAALRNFSFIPVTLLSALKSEGIVEVIKKTQDVFEAGAKKIDDELIEESVVARIEENPPSSRLRFLRLRQVGVLPPKFDLITNVAKDISETYQRFVIKEIRNYFGFFGNPIKLIIKSKSKP
jgi:GTP-binding protein